ncbi:MAG: helix-turn-helix domain-containing protein [Streptosporangiales bacterium]|nr:helix-turn-helix domain-containing protein [Streptosporangiales bacterium]
MSMAPESPKRGGVQSIDRAVALLRCFTPGRPELSASEFARLTGLSTSTTHRLLSALQANGLVRQVAHRRYELGPLVLRLSHAVTARLDLRDAARPAMRRLRDLTGETVGLHVLLPNLTRAVVDQVESDQSLRRTYVGLGEPIPLNQGGPGKVLLAFLSERDREEVLARPLEAATPTTPVDPDTLRTELAAIRAQGYAISPAQRVPGINTVAVPIWDHTGRVTASISVTGPAPRLPEERLRELAAPAREAAWRVSELLGAAPEASHGEP